MAGALLAASKVGLSVFLCQHVHQGRGCLAEPLRMWSPRSGFRHEPIRYSLNRSQSWPQLGSQFSAGVRHCKEGGSHLSQRFLKGYRGQSRQGGQVCRAKRQRSDEDKDVEKEWMSRSLSITPAWIAVFLAAATSLPLLATVAVVPAALAMAFLVPAVVLGFTVLQISMSLLFLFFPLAFVFGIPFGILGSLKGLLSSFLSISMIANFTAAAVRFSRPPASRAAFKGSGSSQGLGRNSKTGGKVVEVTEAPSWLAPAFVSCVPGINGLAWFMAISEAPEVMDKERRGGFVRNALLYGTPGLLLLLKGLSGNTSGSWNGPWWMALVLGAIHLQLEKKLVTEEVEGVLSPGARKQRKRSREAEKAARAAEEEMQRMKEELDEFDSLLVAKTGPLDDPKRWSVAEVSEWLRQEGLGQHAGVFAENDIDGKVLLGLSMEEAREELGVQSFGDRKRLAAALQQLQERKSRQK